MTNRIEMNDLLQGQSWPDTVADEIIRKHPNREEYTLAAGISPSGVVHFGNFRDVATAHFVRQSLEKERQESKTYIFLG